METIKSERQKMIAGELYFAGDPELATARVHAREQMALINNEKDTYIRRQLLQETFGSTGTGAYVEPTISFDYGFNIHVGKNFYANFNNIYLDVCPIKIGDNCMFGPNVQLYTATHPLHPVKRNSGLEYGKPITIGNNVWIGGGAILAPGVVLGNNVVVGAGAVVTKSFPDNSFIGGNPAKLIKTVEVDGREKDSSLANQREKVDSLDKELVALLEQRMDIVTEIAAIKKATNQQIFDPVREQKVIEKISSYVSNKQYQEVIAETYQGIMDASKNFQQQQMK
ncbi:chorismate mutase [Enterococcus rivorum]|uniref:Chorismate mutase n=1 Tax=Enterococcus rivorum TaxID=762845 RepID=A0A1E5L0Y7_9ENTE|nr:chorismate mutase [Enterococcus rivorum]MBP2098683.1 maltose O-acetyltransferase [Enterococcus rivorum]OEH83776.1 chorismate mutase [Enterococcus rivorum]